MDFQVLGSLRVDDAGEQFDLGGPVRRAVLALLIASAGTPVAMDALLMGAYGPDANPKARRSIQTYISGYRKSMGVAIDRSGEGYVLKIDPGAIDAIRFEESILHAKSVINEEMSSAVLREALDLWRGRPYADVEITDGLEPEIRRLEALWAQAIDARIQLDLSAGRHREVLAELEALIAQHPHREGLRGHQMVALYRCGRQADALRAFRQTEMQLREELGVDPSPELRRLEQRILEQDPALDYRPRARARPIPARYTSHIGRETETEAVRDLVADHRLVTITGPGGVGKSSLGVEVARSLSDEMATVYVPIEANREADPRGLLAISLGLQPSRDADVDEMLVDALGHGPTLLLLDGCEHVLDALPVIIVGLLTRCPEVRLLVTSRESLSITGENVFPLSALDHGDGSASNRLFLERAGIDPETLDDRGRAQVSDIGRRLSGLPLGLELASARSRTMSLDEITDRLADQTDLLKIKRGGVAHHRSLVEALDWSYDLLDSDMKESFRRLGAFPTGIVHHDAAARVLGVDRPSDVLAELADVSLVVRPTGDDEHFRLLEPIRQYAEMRLDEDGDLDRARLQYAGWIVELCSRVADLQLRGDLGVATRVVRRHAPSIAATAAWAIDHDHPDVVLGIVAGAGRIWPSVADPALLLEPGMRALERPEAADHQLRIRAVAHTAYLHTPERPDAARRLMARLGDESPDAWDLRTRQLVASVRAAVMSRTSRWLMSRDTALEILHHVDESIRLAEELGYPSESHLYNRALILRQLRRGVEEREHIDRLLSWAGDSRPLWRAMALLLVAKSHMDEGDSETTVEVAREASRLFVDDGDFDFAGQAESWVAHSHANGERYELASEALLRVDEYRALVGLSSILDWHPGLVARCMGGMQDWPAFEDAMRSFYAIAPDPSDREAFEAFINEGEDDVPEFPQLMVPLSQWLLAVGRSHDAARIVAAGPMVYGGARREVWEALGDVDRMDRFSRKLGMEADGGVPETLEDLYWFMRGSFELASEDSPSSTG